MPAESEGANAREGTGGPRTSIRPATPGDFPAIERIYHRAYRGLEPYAYESHWTPEEREKYTREYLSWAYEEEPEGFFVLEADGEVVGFVSVHTWGEGRARRAEIIEIAVDPDYQRHGLGRLLLDHAEQYAKSKGCAKIQLWVGSGNRRALEIYRKRGYREDSRYERWTKMLKDL